MNKQRPTNRHHMLQKCEKELYNIHDPRNIVVMDMVQHTALHQLFRCLTTPKDQLEKLRDMFAPILSPLAQNIFEELLKLSDEQFYDVGMVK